MSISCSIGALLFLYLSTNKQRQKICQILVVVTCLILIVAFGFTCASINTTNTYIHSFSDYGWRNGARLSGRDIHGKRVTNYDYCTNNFDCYTKSLRLWAHEQTSGINVDELVATNSISLTILFS